MLKLNNIVKIALSCVGTLAVCGGIIFAAKAVSGANQQALTESPSTEEVVPAFTDEVIPTGRYYLNGDVNSEYWLDVTDTEINMVGPDLEGLYYQGLKSDRPDEDDSRLRTIAKNSIEPYLHPNNYRAVRAEGMDQINVMIEWTEEDGLISGYGYVYVGENTIKWGSTTPFVLVE